jgi:integrase/recombinase XerD
MAFSCKIILAERPKEDRTRMVYLQAIIDRMRALVPLGFYLKAEHFDTRRQVVKTAHPNAESYNTEILAAIAKANGIASKFRLESKPLSPMDFRTEFLEPSRMLDVMKFIKTELELRKPELAANTHKQHTTVINKLDAFREWKKIGPYLLFSHLTPDLMQQFKNYLRTEGNADPTIDKIMKIVKQYLEVARKKGISFRDPFVLIKIRNYKSNRISLSQKELDKLEAYFNKASCPKGHKRLLQYFLFSCFTGLRISDVKRITWTNVHDDLLTFTAEKGKKKRKLTHVPLNTHDKKFLPPFKPGGKPVFSTFTDQTNNRILKAIASKLDIKKKVTYHTSRHTFGTLFAEGGNIVALQKIMGHEDIKTTMGYVHTSTKNLIDAKKERFGE